MHITAYLLASPDHWASHRRCVGIATQHLIWLHVSTAFGTGLKLATLPQPHLSFSQQDGTKIHTTCKHFINRRSSESELYPFALPRTSRFTTTSTAIVLVMNSAIVRARVLALIFVAATLLFFFNVALAFLRQQQPIPLGLSKLLSTEMSHMTYDFFTSTFFHATYLWLLNGPSFCFVPCRIWAILTPFLSNFIPLIYVTYLLFITKESIVSVLLPFSWSSPSSNYQQVSNKYINKVIMGYLDWLFGTTFVCFAILSVSHRASFVKQLFHPYPHRLCRYGWNTSLTKAGLQQLHHTGYRCSLGRVPRSLMALRGFV